MGQFCFHIKDGEELIPDEDGLDLPDVDVAKTEALHCARDMLADAIKAGKDSRRGRAHAPAGSRPAGAPEPVRPPA